MAKKKKKKKGKDKEEKTLGYYDGIIFSGLSPEELDKEYERLKEESDKLTDWPEM